MSNPPRPTEKFDPDCWYGDFDELVPVRDLLCYSTELCDQTFCSKNEAYAAGLHLGELATERGVGS
jgi:hypothetical protein